MSGPPTVLKLIWPVKSFRIPLKVSRTTVESWSHANAAISAALRAIGTCSTTSDGGVDEPPPVREEPEHEALLLLARQLVHEPLRRRDEADLAPVGEAEPDLGGGSDLRRRLRPCRACGRNSAPSALMSRNERTGFPFTDGDRVAAPQPRARRRAARLDRGDEGRERGVGGEERRAPRRVAGRHRRELLRARRRERRPGQRDRTLADHLEVERRARRPRRPPARGPRRASPVGRPPRRRGRKARAAPAAPGRAGATSAGAYVAETPRTPRRSVSMGFRSKSSEGTMVSGGSSAPSRCTRKTSGSSGCGDTRSRRSPKRRTGRAGAPGAATERIRSPGRSPAVAAADPGATVPMNGPGTGVPFSATASAK